ncbi:MAG: hypothetical protein AB7U83_13110 [Vicinamibacterales bacterium]
MARLLLRGSGGDLSLPDPATIMIDRADGGQLVVHPPRRVWDRSALERDELVAWSLLVAATGRAMLDCLPQLDGGCVNYWDAGNWALNDAADPPGPKPGPTHRVLHHHVIGRSPRSGDADWRWGESPFFPAFADRLEWSRGKAPLTAAECGAIVVRVRELLTSRYEVPAAEVVAGVSCVTCGYPAPRSAVDAAGWCEPCASGR